VPAVGVGLWRGVNWALHAGIVLGSDCTCAHIENARVQDVGGHSGVRRGLVGMLLALHTAMRACIVRMPCPLCPACLCSRVECVVSGDNAQAETHAAAPETHAQVPLHALEHAAGCMRESALRLRASHWHVCACVQILSGLLTG